MDYFKVIKRAAEITWTQKSTWLFGILLAVFQGGSRFNYNFNSSNFNYEGNSGGYNEFIEALLSPLVLVIIVLLVLFLVVVSIFVGFLARAALIGMVKDVEAEGSTSVSKGFRWGWSYWLSLFGINLVIWIPFGFFAMLISVLLLSPAIVSFVLKQIVLGIVLLILAVLLILVLLIPAGLGLSVMEALSERFRVMKGTRVFESIGEGYRMIHENLGTVFIFWLIMLLIGFGLGLVLLPITLLLLAPAIAFLFVNVLIGIALGIPGILILIFVGGVIQTFTSVTWTEFFLELKGINKVDSELVGSG